MGETLVSGQNLPPTCFRILQYNRFAQPKAHHKIYDCRTLRFLPSTYDACRATTNIKRRTECSFHISGSRIAVYSTSLRCWRLSAFAGSNPASRNLFFFSCRKEKSPGQKRKGHYCRKRKRGGFPFFLKNLRRVTH